MSWSLYYSIVAQNNILLLQQTASSVLKNETFPVDLENDCTVSQNAAEVGRERTNHELNNKTAYCILKTI